MPRTTEAIVHKQYFISQVVNIVKQEPKRPWISNRRRKIDAVNSARPLILQVHGPHFQESNLRRSSLTRWQIKRRTSSFQRRNKLKTGKEWDVPVFRVIEPISCRFAAAADDENYPLLKSWKPYDDVVAHNLEKMGRKISVQMNKGAFAGNVRLRVTVFLRKYRSACDARRIHEDAAMWISRQYLTCPAEAVVNLWVTLKKLASFKHEVALKSYSAVVKFSLKCNITDDIIAKSDTEGHNLK